MEIRYDIPNIKGEDAEVKIIYDTISLLSRKKFSKFRKDGMLLMMVDSGDIFPIGPYDDVLCDPTLGVVIDEPHKRITYNLAGKGACSVPLEKTYLFQIIRGQHDLAETVYERLTSNKFEPLLEARKYLALEILDNIANFDTHSYLDFNFVRR